MQVRQRATPNEGCLMQINIVAHVLPCSSRIGDWKGLMWVAWADEELMREEFTRDFTLKYEQATLLIDS